MEVSRLSGMDNDLFTYNVEVANIPCNSVMDDDLEDETDDDVGYDPSDLAFIEWLRSKNFNYKTMDQYTMKALWIYWIRGDDEVELTDEEYSDDEDEIAKNKDVPWVDEKPWTDTGVWTELKPVKHTCEPFNYKTGCSEWPTYSWKEDGYCNGGNLLVTYIIENQLHYQDYEWYEALDDSELKKEALRNKAIMDGVINNDESAASSRENITYIQTMMMHMKLIMKIMGIKNYVKFMSHRVLYKVEDIATYLVEYVKFWDDWGVDRYGNANLGVLWRIEGVDGGFPFGVDEQKKEQGRHSSPDRSVDSITGYDDYIQGNITICHVYYVEGLGHNLFSIGQFCDGDLEVAFCSKTCYVRNLKGDDLLTGGRESNFYTICISDLAASSPVCLMSKATSTKSWLWHRRLSHLNFGTINDLFRLDLVDGLPKFKYGKDHLCSAYERGKSKKVSHPPKLVPSDHSKLELLHMDLCGPMRVASINGKKYILVIWMIFLDMHGFTFFIQKTKLQRL
ncbi:integrase, catalytic region, zinc finger, CCHC-type containing protein [Tanacetum coccineum]